ncbi:MAG TPA: gamma-glutamyl-gamma-aminobutyrate hydrolase family protein [Candidatus Angelobacter sp.]|nr:gamma-glutamyl-gamma-aminobutyrate hydrolase family protein [Candidatus Angelobacter sp.]
MKRPPLILISPSFELRGVEFSDLSVSLSLRYEQAVLAAGGLPMIGPATLDRRLLAESVGRADGVLLPGGDDINPYLYEAKLPRSIRQTVSTTPDGGRRDTAELMLIAEIFHQQKPVLAICRGHQMLHVAFGGKLVVDIAQQTRGAINHRQVNKAFRCVHDVELSPGSLIAKITGKRRLGVNSTHHQAIREPADPFIASARSSDGLVEAMELKPEFAAAMPFLLGVQFHPERLIEKGDQYQEIFRGFVKACRAASRNSSKKQNGFLRSKGPLLRAANPISANR